MLIVEYLTEWINQFQKIKEKLLEGMSGLPVTIEHVGSTSVPGLSAKPIIDIDIVYHGVSDFKRVKDSLESLGYAHNGNQGIEGREVFKRAGQKEDEILDKTAHHLYVCSYDCEELRRHILFRDYLRCHETARIFYQNLKYKIAIEAGEDRKTYAGIKELKANSFIDYIVELSKQDKSGSQV
jgi:GrpB-like predicted nucleotidyltransferase (UPF0157 family)